MKKIADNYKERVKIVIKQLFSEMEIIVGRPAKRPLSENKLEAMIPEFPAILNWMTRPYREHGIPTPFYSGPLDEEELRFIESRFLRGRTTVIRDEETQSLLLIRTFEIE